MEAGEAEPRFGWVRCPDDRGGGAVRRRALPRGAWRRAAGRRVPAERDLAPVHSEGRWKAATAGDPDGPRPGGADGGEAGAGADLRGGLLAVLVWLPARAEPADGAGDLAQAWVPAPSRAGRRHPRLFREHFARQVDEARRTTCFGSQGPEADPAVARGRRDGGWRGPVDDDRGTAGRGDLTAPVQDLPARARHAVDASQLLVGDAGALRRRPR